MSMKRVVHFEFDIPTPIAGVPKNIFASEFSDQNMNRNHVLAASAIAGTFTLSFLTKGNADEVIEKACLKSQTVSAKAAAAGGWSIVLPYQTTYWSYQAQNSDGYSYLFTFPLVLFNAANVQADVPAGGIIINMDFEISLV
ncbi:hypothetical protein RHABOEDO_001895 (plasmid) [Candidatus Rhabdochlamydia oedothoracis]|uniref:Uncharacterized protein n=1 Tax=Candidatus Rhabdochlamydia oedothoracis TaxID=2720720 RepID=A0ABX8V7D1_9BACT|nr:MULTISPECIES: hypothetical protein [Rhabdochlamydia]KAG6558729.1 hypothetical protein RHOW815_001282 [Candidatus Rhabdochlamydia sp. W815]QYF49497.1 hypothetical protein RHABOEDO_001895 [Candidatus Rhabdochlamydia oedothoracis]